MPRVQRLRDQIQNERWAAHRREHELIAVFVEATRRSMERRLDEMNELRHQIERERTQYLTVESFNRQHQAIEQALDRVQTSVWMGMGGVSALVVIVGALVGVFHHG
jgi:hypothetical protein